MPEQLKPISEILAAMARKNPTLNRALKTDRTAVALATARNFPPTLKTNSPSTKENE